jgi:hypothetical protein
MLIGGDLSSLPRRSRRSPLSYEDEEEKRTTRVEGTPAAPSSAVPGQPQPVPQLVTAVPQPAPAAQALPVERQRREETITHRRTNLNVLVALVLGAVVILLGIYFVFTQISFLRPPLSYVAFLLAGVLLIAFGARLVSRGA